MLKSKNQKNGYGSNENPKRRNGDRCYIFNNQLKNRDVESPNDHQGKKNDIGF